MHLTSSTGFKNYRKAVNLDIENIFNETVFTFTPSERLGTHQAQDVRTDGCVCTKYMHRVPADRYLQPK